MIAEGRRGLYKIRSEDLAWKIQYLFQPSQDSILPSTALLFVDQRIFKSPGPPIMAPDSK